MSLFPLALSDPSSRLSTSPPPPAIAVPLLEMGFSLRQITKALEATGQSVCSSLLPLFLSLCGGFSKNHEETATACQANNKQIRFD